MINNPIIFYLASTILVVFTILALCFKNVIRSLLSAIMVFFATAIFFYILGSEYNAIVQVAIYGLAVPIIIGISIMFTGENKKNNIKFSPMQYFIIFIASIFILAFTYLVMISLAINPNTFHKMNLIPINSYETIFAFSKGIFIKYVWAFELVSILLTIVIAGISLFKKKGV